ncbi:MULTISPECIES: hypothetical protein [Halomonas]|uniref:hypothetical protein n=1 Tax=Halomonas TaxID=2745 RepID=UPI001C977DA5|nr:MULTISPECIES: hypothetical protein [Halomonas]MBY6206126.1 hypothetical protein [Halomonas sp. DP3Y7-2]MBY6227983.1 hypothetical protein [Halomonas sp. DP3Y7-1]MCA0916050.1 hypothetical protein [Halomonas denitrificans]
MMAKNNALINKGIVVVGNPKSDRTSPIIVIGTARGGTSMVAGVLARLGVYMGDRASHPVYEDVRLSSAFERNERAKARHIINEYDAKHGHWGWKRPSIIDRLSDVDTLIPNARYIFIYKDILSIAQRNSISMLEQVTTGMERALTQYQNTLDFINRGTAHAMLVSYDKATAYPDVFLSMLEEFCSIHPSREQHDSARSFIDPEPEDYIEATRITKSQGSLVSFDGQRVRGWAQYVHRGQHAEVEIFIGERSIGVVTANEADPGCGAPDNLACGFSFTLPKDEGVLPGECVRARVVNDVVDLVNSPMRMS